MFLAGFVAFSGVLLYTRGRMMDHFRKVDENAAIQSLNRSLDIVQAEIRNIRILAKSVALMDERDTDYEQVMELLNLDFLAISTDGIDFQGTPGLVRMNGIVQDIDDIRLFFRETLKGPFSIGPESEWGFLETDSGSDVYVLSTDHYRIKGRRVVVGRLLAPAMNHYVKRSDNAAIRFSNNEVSGSQQDPMSVNDIVGSNPVFERATRDEVRFRINDEGQLEASLVITTPYLDQGLHVLLTRSTDIRDAGQHVMAILNGIYIVVFLLFMGLLALWVYRTLSRPMGKLIISIQMWDGIRLPDMKGQEERNDEIGLLARTFLRMSGDIIIKTRSLEEQAVRDGLTGLFNRRRFDESFIAEWDRHKRKGLSLAVVMADIDFFKNYNDSYGHPEGDRCLREVAGICAQCLRRPGDVAFRYGGEEFAFILADTDLSGAEKVAETIRLAVEQKAITHQDGVSGGIITISLGLAVCSPGSDDSCQERGALLGKADQALYKAKVSGRNRVVSS